MKSIATPHSACNCLPAPQSVMHESCSYSFERTRTKRFYIPGLHSFLQSHMSLSLLSAGRKMYIPFVPLTLLVYDPDDESCMFNKERAELKTICLKKKQDNRKNKNSSFHSEKINFQVHNRSFDCNYQNVKSYYLSLHSNYSGFHSEHLSLPSDYSGFNCKYSSFNSEYRSLNSEYRSLNSEYRSLKSDNVSLNSEYQGLNSKHPSLKSENSNLKSEYTGLNSKYQSLKSKYPSLRSEYASLKNESESLNTGICKIAGENPFSNKTSNNHQNIQVWSQSNRDVSIIYRELEDPDRFRMPNGGQHAGLRESIQHWKR